MPLFFFIIKRIRCTYFTNLFSLEILHVSGSSSAHHQEFIHSTLGTGICHTSLNTVFKQRQTWSFHPCPAWKLSSNQYDIPVPSVQWIKSWWWAEELPETCRVSTQNKFGKLVHLIGFIIKKFITMHGHMNVKKKINASFVAGTTWKNSGTAVKFLLQLQIQICAL
jgi:hypothetical protein